MKAQIISEDDAKPMFHKAHAVPYAKGKAYLQHLKDQGILSEVDWSDWATPNCARSQEDCLRWFQGHSKSCTTCRPVSAPAY